MQNTFENYALLQKHQVATQSLEVQKKVKLI